MMEQHPIPQQISSYQFKLVGEMTLNQFFRVAGGIIIAFIINSTGIFGLIRWPLMIIAAGGGVAFAFGTIQDRPLETWVLSFFRAIWAPTFYTYQKGGDKNWLGWKGGREEENKEEDRKEEEVEMESVKSNWDKKKIKINLRDEAEEVVLESKKVKKQESEKVETPTIKQEEKQAEEARPEEEDKTEKKDDWRDKKVKLDLERRKLEATGEAVFGSIPMPSIPEVPNLVVGMVTDFEGKIIEGALVEIQDDKGNPVRVLKTNSLGQFKTSSPLANGRYLVIPEKEDYKFDRVNIVLSGKIVEPIRIRAVE